VNTKLNLAAKPFTNRILPWTVSAVLLFTSLIAFVFILRAAAQANAEASVVKNEIRRLRQEEESLRVKADQVKQSLTPEQFATLSATHELVDRKRFSWTRLFADLEAALPGTVKVTRISVRDVAARGEQTIAELDLNVVAKSSTTITQMIAQMDRDGIFQAELRAQNLQKGRGESGTEYELYVTYRPRAGAPLSDTRAANMASAAETENLTAGDRR
jgi:Tfp pilus assembly protein PilN